MFFHSKPIALKIIPKYFKKKNQTNKHMRDSGYIFTPVLPRAGGTYSSYTVFLILRSSAFWGDGEDANPNNRHTDLSVVLSVCRASQHAQQLGWCTNTVFTKNNYNTNENSQTDVSSIRPVEV